MKQILFYIIILVCSITYGQWNEIDPPFLGINDDINVGAAVSFNGDGSVVAYAKAESGAVNTTIKVFDLDNSPYTQIGQDIEAYRSLGSGTNVVVKLNSTGDIVAVSAPDYTDNESMTNRQAMGRIDMYQLQDGIWIALGQPIIGEPFQGLGWSIDLSNAGNRLIVGSGDFRGLAKVFEFNGEDWTQIGEDLSDSQEAPAQNEFGLSVEISGDGNTIAVGNPEFNSNTGKVEVYEIIGNMFSQKGNFILGAQEGAKLAHTGLAVESIILNELGNHIAVSSIGTGTVDVYEIINDNWVLLGQQIATSGTGLSGSLAFNDIGDFLAIGDATQDNGRGEVKVYKYESSTWTQVGQTLQGIEINNPLFGFTVDISNDGSRVSVGSPLENTGQNNAGSVRLFTTDETLGNAKNTEHKYLIYPNPNKNSFVIENTNLIDTVTVSIYTITGKNVFTNTYQFQSATQISHQLPLGLYIVELASEKSNATFKMVVN